MAPPSKADGSSAELAAPPCVGRERELAALTRALAEPSAVVVLEGEAGIGKSRLVRELLATPSMAGRRSLIAPCPPFREVHTLSPVIDAVREAVGAVPDPSLSELAGALRPFFPEWTAHLPPPPEPLAEARAARHRLFRALAELIDRLDAAVLVVDDVHWADDATAEFLLFLAAGAGPRPSLILTYRPEDLPDGSLVRSFPARLPEGTSQLRLSLGPLDPEQTARLASSMLASPDNLTELGQTLHRHTAGIPLAVEELVRLLSDRVDPSHRTAGWIGRELDRVGVPPTIRDAVLERAARLDPPAQVVLRAAAVLADPEHPAAVAALSELDREELDGALTAALRARLLDEDRHGRIAFRHALAARAIYRTIPPAARRALHLRAARLLERRSPPPVTRLVRHFRDAGESAAWFRYAEQAADRALRSGDEASAATLLTELVESPDLPPVRMAPLVDKLPFLGFVGPARLEGLMQALRAARDSAALTPTAHALTQFQLARILAIAGQDEVAAVEAERAIELLATDSVEAVRAMILLGKPDLTPRAAANHLWWLRRSAEVAAPLTPADRLNAAVERLTALLQLGEQAGWEEASRLPANPPDSVSGQHLIRGQVNLADAAIYWGRYDQARARLPAALAMADQHDLPAVREAVLSTRTYLDWFIGEWGGLAERAAALSGEQDASAMIRIELTLVGALVRSATGAAGADRELAEVLADARRYGLVQPYLLAAAALARRHLVAGEVDRALAVTDEPIRIVTGKQIWLWAAEVAPVRVEALVTAGQVAAAAELVAAFGRGLRGRRIPSARAALSRGRATLVEGQGQYARAAALYRRAARAWQAMPRPYEALLALERAGECLVAAGDGAAGVALLSDALAGLSALGARPAADRVLRRLRGLGSRARRSGRGGRPGYGDRLSPRELEVVRLLRDGLTNRQIAAELVVSAQTVASHVRSAMRKLDVSSRTAVAVRALELGLIPAGRTGHSDAPVEV